MISSFTLCSSRTTSSRISCGSRASEEQREAGLAGGGVSEGVGVSWASLGAHTHCHPPPRPGGGWEEGRRKDGVCLGGVMPWPALPCSLLHLRHLWSPPRALVGAGDKCNRLLQLAPDFCTSEGSNGPPACHVPPRLSPAPGSFMAYQERTHSPVSFGPNRRHPGPRRSHFQPASSWGGDEWVTGPGPRGPHGGGTRCGTEPGRPRTSCSRMGTAPEG